MKSWPTFPAKQIVKLPKKLEQLQISISNQIKKVVIENIEHNGYNWGMSKSSDNVKR